MKKFSVFLIKLKPYRRLYKIFWMCFIIIALFLFQMLMLLMTLFVPHQNSGFYYWINGLHSLLGQSRSEPNSAQGFIFAATIIGFIPIIPIIPVLYFTFANWFIQERLSDKFIEIPKEKYLKWSKFIHFSGIAVVFLLIPGILSYLGGGGILPQHTWAAIPGTFTNNLASRIGGISAFLYYGVGCVFALIIIMWTIGMVLAWIGRQIKRYFNYLGQKINDWKERRRAAKIERIEQKSSRKDE
ncbi:hypothetical protein [Spiroplasma culicicola]|uniref:Transmembrane protein n=1 Tax=Spiroplasma culicicola AES-1 TaxID=1276246 RepID=W6AH99_9MOLU|nr:hypothetical protein [Spiroplasma culicicola]AHI53064.1 hypothetical protein SCULI_v1c07230 [Spiroplasma culicicola AES-1]